MSWQFLNLRAILLVGFLCGMADHSPAQAGDDPTPPDPLRELTIYVPYHKLPETFEREGRGIYLPYEKFQELWKAAREHRPLPTPKEGPPVGGLITEADSRATVTGDVIKVSADIQLRALGTGWIEIPIQLADAALLSITENGTPATVRILPDGTKALVIQRTASDPIERSLHLEYAKRVDRVPGKNSVTFQPPLAPINRWRIEVPEAGVQIRVEPMLAATQSDAPTDTNTNANTSGTPSSHLEVFVGAVPKLEIEWTPKTEGAHGLEALVNVRAEQTARIEEGIVHTRTVLDYEISRAELSELTLTIPADHKVVNVMDENVKQWRVEALGGQQKLYVRLHQGAHNQQTLLVETEQIRTDPAAQAVTIPAIQAEGVSRQTGYVSVSLAPGLRAEPSVRRGLLQVDAAELPESMAREADQLSYRFKSVPFELTFRVETIVPRIDVQQLVLLQLEPESITMDLLADYHVDRAGIYQLHIDLPDGFEVRSVTEHAHGDVGPIPVESHQVTGQTGRQLIVQLLNKVQGKAGVRVRVTRALDDPNLVTPTGVEGQIHVVPLRVSPASVSTSRGQFALFAPDSIRTNIQDAKDIRSISGKEMDLERWSIAKETGTRRLAAAFAFEGDSQPQLTILAERRAPQVSVRQLLLTRVDAGTVQFEATFHYDIQYSGVKSLRIDLPADIASRVRNQNRALEEQTLTEAPNIAPDYVAWSFSGETELIGAQTIVLTWELPLPGWTIGKSADITVPRLLPSADRHEGQIVIVKGENIDVQPHGDPVGLLPIDPLHDLYPGVTVANAAAALEFHDDNWQLQLRGMRHESAQIKHSSIERALLRLVATRADRLSVQALYRIRSNQQRLEVLLPDEVAPHKVEFDTDPLRINGQPVPLERGDQPRLFYIPLVGAASDKPNLVELRYTVAGSVSHISYPVFPSDPAIQQVHLAVYLPDEWTYLGARGPWTETMTWHPFGHRQRRPEPNIRIEDLIREMVRDVPISSNTIDEYPVHGSPLLFSTLQPPVPEEGALRLTVTDWRLLHAPAFIGVVICGALMLRKSLVTRIWLALVLVLIATFVGLFFPNILSAIGNESAMVAIALVVFAWLVAILVQGLSRARDWSSSFWKPPAVAYATAEPAAPAGTSPPLSTPTTSSTSAEGPRHE